jgi:CBS-domain-containing membrane protein
MSVAFPNHDTVLIVASFGASAVLCFSTIESPLAQPRHLLGGQILSAVLGVGLNRLFRMAPSYRLEDTIGPNELGQLVWVNGALSMSLSLLLMQVTGTTHPP